MQAPSQLPSRGILAYDFGHGDEPYKYTFGATDKLTSYLSVERRALGTGLLDPLSYPQAALRRLQHLSAGRDEDAERIAKQLSAGNF